MPMEENPYQPPKDAGPARPAPPPKREKSQYVPLNRHKIVHVILAIGVVPVTFGCVIYKDGFNLESLAIAAAISAIMLVVVGVKYLIGR